jgi:hypothetical protein
MGLFLSALFWSSHRYIDSQRVSGLEQELFSLTKKFESGGLKKVAEEISERQSHKLRKGRYYLLVGPDGAKIAGNLLAWPSDSHVSRVRRRQSTQHLVGRQCHSGTTTQR